MQHIIITVNLVYFISYHKLGILFLLKSSQSFINFTSHILWLKLWETMALSSHETMVTNRRRVSHRITIKHNFDREMSPGAGFWGHKNQFIVKICRHCQLKAYLKVLILLNELNLFLLHENAMSIGRQNMFPESFAKQNVHFWRTEQLHNINILKRT